MAEKISGEFNDQEASEDSYLIMSEYGKLVVKLHAHWERQAERYRASGEMDKVAEITKFAADTQANYEILRARYIADLRAQGFDLDPHGNIVSYFDPAPNL